ncbi:MAG: HDOD domain-containing protein [Deferribacteres bacterium]|nr:HDOD domain-containing protein [Deferribacteres bacterium]
MRDLVISKIESLENLPTLPEIVTEVMRIVQTDDFSVKELKNIIEKDPVLTAKLLKIANTFYYNPYGKEITSTERAIIQLGTKNLLPIVFGLSLIKVFTIQDDSFDVKLFWKHSYTCAHIAKRIAKYFNLPDAEAFTAGLLHDVGKIVLYMIFPKDYLKAIELTETENIPMFEAERRVFDIDHAEVGEILLNKWHIPQLIIEPVRYHHEPDKAPSHKYFAALINIANIFTRASGQYFGKDTYGVVLEETPGWLILKKRIKEEDVEELIMPINDDVEEAIEFANIAWG